MSDHSENIQLFASLTGAETNVAESYLEACGWSVEDAFNMWSASGDGSAETPVVVGDEAVPSFGEADEPFDRESADARMAAALAEEFGNTPSIGGSSAPGGGPVPRDDYDGDGVRAPSEYTTGRLVDDSPFGGIGGLRAGLGGMRGGRLAGSGPDDVVARLADLHGMGGGGGAAMAGGGGGGASLHDPNASVGALLAAMRGGDDVATTAAAAAMMMGGAGGAGGGGRMMHGGGGGGGGGAAGVVDVPESDWMFPVPVQIKRLNCGGEIAYARQRAKEERKWVFVSMLSLDIFDSHRLHRDTFSDETLLSVIEASFVFWQRSSSSAQGQAFLGRYQLSADALPMVAIIGPTGALAYSSMGFVTPNDLSQVLVEFLDRNDLDSVEAPKVRKGSGADLFSHIKASPSSQSDQFSSSSSSGGNGDAAGNDVVAAAYGLGAGDGDTGASEEERSLAEAIRLSMLEDAVLAATDEAVTASLSSPPAYAVGSSGSGKSGAAAADDEDGSSDAALAALLGQQASIGTSNGSSSSSSYSSNGAGCSPERSGGDKAAAESAQKYKDEEEKEPHLPASVASGSFSLGAEPKAGEAGTTRLQLRLASGKTMVRRFLLEDTVATLFAVVVDLVPEARATKFTLQTPIAAAGFKLLDHHADTLASHGLANSKIIMQWE